ncbi:MAG: FecR domain-containing protein, partial [Pseudomonadota bacterium]
AVSAVNRDMDGTPPGAERRPLLLGNQVVADELIQTSEVGSGQLMFLDQTSLTVAPNSNIVLDTYVYDPVEQTGDMAISLTRGVLRFVGGRISKSRDVEVRTPTATIGIRGGMVMIIVGEDGATRVIFTAGEYVVVTDGVGTEVALSRPNAMANIPVGGIAEFIGLATSADYGRAYARLEGSGDGGSGIAAAQGSPGATDPDAATGEIAAVNSAVEGGETNQPISTSGEQPVSEPEEAITLGNLALDPNSDVGLQPPVQEDPAMGPPPPPPPPATTVLGGGVFTETLDLQTFTSVTQGSLIGTTASGEVITVPVPETPGDFVADFSSGPTPTFFAESIANNSGFFEFGQTPGTAGSSTTLGSLSGVGFADLDEEFYFAEITSGSFERGVVIFGEPTPGQQSVSSLENGSVPASANTVSVFQAEPTLVDGGSTDIPVLVIANGGEARFPHPSHTLASNGGQVLITSATIRNDPSLGQVSTFTVSAPVLFQDGTGGLRFGGKAFATTVDGTGFFEISEPTVGTFENINGDTVFGEDNQYMLLTSLRRAANGSPSGTADFETDNFGTQRLLGGTDSPEDPFANVATLNPAGEELVLDPFPRALGPATAVAAAQAQGLAVEPLLTGYAAGVARCSDGACGSQLTTTGDSGVIGVRGEAVSQFQTTASGQDSNTMLFALDLEYDDPTGQGQAQTDPDFIAFSTNEERSVYADDSRFGGSFAFESPDPSAPSYTFGYFAMTPENAGSLASLFPSGTLPQSDYLTWGVWSATYDTSSAAGAPREDGIQLGFFVQGAPPDPNLIGPTLGTVSYSGSAAGERVLLGSGFSEKVGGTFSATYDFEVSRGTFDISIGNGAITGASMVGDPSNLAAYTVTGAGAGLQLEATGGFFAGGNDPVAATAGDFRIEDQLNNAVTTGVFGGDRQ